jgi:hypothetical protein
VHFPWWLQQFTILPESNLLARRGVALGGKKGRVMLPQETAESKGQKNAGQMNTLNEKKNGFLR